MIENRALLLTPSRGLGGGIERYVETVEWSLAAQGIEHKRIDLLGAGFGAHFRMWSRARQELRVNREPTQLVLAHRTLLPLASVLAREKAVCGISVVCHGSDVWGLRLRPRWYIESRLMRRPGVRVVAVSSFTAGVLSGIAPATVLPPGLSQEWFRILVRASSRRREEGDGIELLTAFRLADWRDKGLPQLLSAVAALRRPEVQVTVCGTGEPSPDLLQLIRDHDCCTLRAGLTDEDFARRLASADLLVLATRTRLGRKASGEGFGLVLLEAQVAGTPVVGPAYGGSRDAFIDNLTGVAPTDESSEALAKVLSEMLDDPKRLAAMGEWAAQWARESFVPEQYAPVAVSRLL